MLTHYLLQPTFIYITSGFDALYQSTATTKCFFFEGHPLPLPVILQNRDFGLPSRGLYLTLIRTSHPFDEIESEPRWKYISVKLSGLCWKTLIIVYIYLIYCVNLFDKTHNNSFLVFFANALLTYVWLVVISICTLDVEFTSIKGVKL